MLRVLLITREPWRDDSNEGSVLSSWFENQPMELAHIYCKPGLPDNRCCKRYFQLTDQMAAKNLLRREPMGAEIDLTAPAQADAPTKSEGEKKSFYDFFRKNNWASFFLIRECLWGLANWKSKALEAFVDNFAPDVIVAPLCYSRYVMAIQRWAAKRTGKPMAGIVWDDLYSFQQWQFSPIYWFNRLLQRRSVRKTVQKCSRLYTLCPQQAEVFGRMFHRSFEVFPKVGEGQEQGAREGETVRFLYAGGVYLGRQETLAQVVDALAALNASGASCRLDVYTNSPGAERLEREGCCSVHSAVSAEQLKKLYQASHVALHVEGFKRADLCQSRLSFSSKIVDCLASGCAVLAVCSQDNCGFRYLRESEAAVCVDQPQEIKTHVEMLVRDEHKRALWASRAKACLDANHVEEKVKALICRELTEAAQQRMG